jgi:hypothetical protein
MWCFQKRDIGLDMGLRCCLAKIARAISDRMPFLIGHGFHGFVICHWTTGETP